MKITYHFNSLGFRGEELDPGAQLKLFACGCSFTFGTGMEIEESWAFLLKQRLAEYRGLAVSSVNLLNFSQGGASNDYITRTLIEQSARVRPDVIVAGFTHMSRFELLGETTAHHFQPTQPGHLEKYEQAGGRFAELGRLAKFLFLGTDENQAKIRMIKNMLLLQYFCRQQGIPFLFFLFESLARDDLPEALSKPMTEPLFHEIDFDLMIPLDPTMKVDHAIDGFHPGRRSQELMAEAAMKTFRARYT